MITHLSFEGKSYKINIHSTYDVLKNYVGTDFYEIKRKSGEFIRNCKHDQVGNQIIDMEKSYNCIAKCVLVLMVRDMANGYKVSFGLVCYAKHNSTFLSDNLKINTYIKDKCCSSKGIIPNLQP